MGITASPEATRASAEALPRKSLSWLPSLKAATRNLFFAAVSAAQSASAIPAEPSAKPVPELMPKKESPAQGQPEKESLNAEQIDDLLKKLDDDEFDIRQQAIRDLVLKGALDEVEERWKLVKNPSVEQRTNMMTARQELEVKKKNRSMRERIPEFEKGMPVKLTMVEEASPTLDHVAKALRNRGFVVRADPGFEERKLAGKLAGGDLLTVIRSIRLERDKGEPSLIVVPEISGKQITLRMSPVLPTASDGGLYAVLDPDSRLRPSLRRLRMQHDQRLQLLTVSFQSGSYALGKEKGPVQEFKDAWLPHSLTLEVPSGEPGELYDVEIRVNIIVKPAEGGEEFTMPKILRFTGVPPKKVP